MWKKDDEQTAQPTAGSTQRAAPPRPTPGQSSAKATIGPSITIDGDVTGSEDLLIQGRITGSVTLDDHAVGVGTEGRVNADIVGRLITVEGQVEGDLTAQEQIVLRGTAKVKGDIKAPRVVLEDGATFRGLVDMGAQPTDDGEKSSADSKASSAASSADSASKASSSGRSSSNGATSSSGSDGSSDTKTDGNGSAKTTVSASDGDQKGASASSKAEEKGSGSLGTGSGKSSASKSGGSGRKSANA